MSPSDRAAFVGKMAACYGSGWDRPWREMASVGVRSIIGGLSAKAMNDVALRVFRQTTRENRGAYPGSLTASRRFQFRPLVLTAAQMQELGDLVDAAGGIPVCVVFTSSPCKLQTDRLRQQLADAGCDVYHATTADYPTDFFSTPAHTNRCGAVRFTSDLARSLRDRSGDLGSLAASGRK